MAIAHFTTLQESPGLKLHPLVLLYSSYYLVTFG